MPTTSVRRLISPLGRSSGFVEWIFGRWSLGKLIKASTSVGVVHQGGEFRYLRSPRRHGPDGFHSPEPKLQDRPSSGSGQVLDNEKPASAAARRGIVGNHDYQIYIAVKQNC